MKEQDWKRSKKRIGKVCFNTHRWFKVKLYWKRQGHKDRDRGRGKRCILFGECLDFCRTLLSVQNNWYSPELSTQAVGLETSTEPSVTPTRLTPQPHQPPHTFPISSSFSLSNSFSAIIHTMTSPLCTLSFLLAIPFFFLNLQIFSPFLSLRLLRSLSLDPLMSAHTCCHIPPVQFSARQDRIKLNYATVDGTGLSWTWTSLDRSRGLDSSSGEVGMAHR